MKLRHWYAVHGRNEQCPSAVGMLSSLRPRVAGLVDDFTDQDGQWRHGAFRFETTFTPAILLRRVLPGDPLFFTELKGWEAELRTWDGPHGEEVIQHMSRTRQTVTLTPIGAAMGSSKLARVCEQLCGCLARMTDGLIQVCQEGFFNADGESLLPCSPRHRLTTR